MWASERFRNLVSQLALVALIVAVAGYAAHNLVHNLESRSITIGFSYLSQEAGFDISEKLLEYDPTHSYGRAFVVGLLNTLFVSAVAIVAASVLGLAIGIARLSPNWLLAKLAGMYIESVRNVPLILQLLLWYGVITDVLPSAASPPHRAGVPEPARPQPSVARGPRRLVRGAAGLAVAFVATLLWWRRSARIQRQQGRAPAVVWPGIALFLAMPAIGWALFGAPTGISMPVLGGFDFEGGKNVSPEFTALFLGLSIYTAAFIAEIVRGGIQAVPKGQTEASEALGLSRGSACAWSSSPRRCA